MWDWLAANPAVGAALVGLIGGAIGSAFTFVAQVWVSSQRAETEGDRIQHEIEESLWARTQAALQQRDIRIDALERDLSAANIEYEMLRSWADYLLERLSEALQSLQKFRSNAITEVLSYEDWKQQRATENDSVRNRSRFGRLFGSSE